jgi:hypothetical protein
MRTTDWKGDPMPAPTIQEHLDELERMRQRGNWEAVLNCPKELLEDYYQVGDIDNAKNYAQELALQASRFHNPKREIYGYEALARLAEDRHDYQQALRHAKRAYEIQQRADINDLGALKRRIDYYEDMASRT